MGSPVLSRRDFIRRSVQLAIAGALIPGAMAQLLPALAPDALASTGPGPIIRRDPKTRAKIPITVADLAGPAPVVVTAEWNFFPTVVYKVKKASLEGSTRVRGYNTAQFALQHPTEPDMAIMVYDGKCKHLGCTVGFDRKLGASKDELDYDGDGLPDGRILCPCHQGQYDIHDLALNVPETPPPVPLNVVEFDVIDYAGEPEKQLPATPQAIYALTKVEQTKARMANGRGNYPALDAVGVSFSTAAFALRGAGWTLATTPATT